MKKERTYQLHIELNEAEQRCLRMDAERCALSKSTYLRKLIMSKPVRPRPTAEIRDLYAEVNHIGNNINQIARSVNAGIATPEDAAQALFLLKKVYALMEEVADA